VAALDVEDFAHHQGICNDRPGIREDPAEALPRHIHHHGRLFLVQALKIIRPDGLKALDGEQGFLAAPGGRSVGDEGIDNRTTLNKSQFTRARHSFFLL
jgi:hypothetical protein